MAANTTRTEHRAIATPVLTEMWCYDHLPAGLRALLAGAPFQFNAAWTYKQLYEKGTRSEALCMSFIVEYWRRKIPRPEGFTNIMMWETVHDILDREARRAPAGRNSQSITFLEPTELGVAISR